MACSPNLFLVFHALPEEKINSSGYVLHTLEASIGCFLTTDSYKAAVLKAVNLGEDTDTTGAVMGGLAGLLYGIETIPTTSENLPGELAHKIQLPEKFF